MGQVLVCGNSLSFGVCIWHLSGWIFLIVVIYNSSSVVSGLLYVLLANFNKVDVGFKDSI